MANRQRKLGESEGVELKELSEVVEERRRQIGKEKLGRVRESSRKS